MPEPRPVRTTHTTPSGGGSRFLAAALFLSLVLAVLKLAELIEITWLLVLSPILLLLGLGAVFLLVLLLVIVITIVVTVRGRRK